MLTNCQSGFRGQHSTVTGLLGASSEWAYNNDSGKVDAVMFLDLKLSIYALWSSTGNYTRSTFIPNSKKADEICDLT